MNNRLILVGASRGIGRHFLENEHTNEKDILAIGSSESVYSLEKLSENIKAEKIQISDLSSIESPIKSWLRNLEPLNNCRYAVVCCASQLGKVGGIFDEDIDVASWTDLFKVNLLSHLKVIQLIEKYMTKHDTLRVVMFAGGGAAYGYPKFFNYSLTKVATVRAVENIAMELESKQIDASIISIAPGAVATKMLEKVIEAGGEVKTKTDISEPCLFISNFINDHIDSKSLNGRFLHVRDSIPKKLSGDQFLLRRIE